MSDNPNPESAPENGGADGGTEFKPITSQDELNRALADRLARERAKYADYKDVKAKADRLDQIEAANKTEAEKVAERIAALEADNQRIQTESLRLRIAAKHGISTEPGKDGEPSDADLFLTGTDEASMTRQAQRLSAQVADRKKQSNVVPSEGKATPPPADDEMRGFARNLFNRATTD
jgi:hypothetical protein